MPSATGRGHRPHPTDAPRRDARAVAAEALVRIEDGAYANLVLPHVLERADLSGPDRHFATELVYGTTRMRRACDWLVDRFVMRPPDAETRTVLRLGAYQLEFLGTPPHAAVSATVAIAPRRTRGMVNAVLRRVAAAGRVASWPGEGVRLSYPDWIVDRLTTDLGPEQAAAALARMNEAPEVTSREDGYVQDRASQWVAGVVGTGPGLVADLCAAPGGKATAIAGGGLADLASRTVVPTVIAADVRPSRARLIAGNVARLSLTNVDVLVGDAARPPLRPRSVDRVLVDAPCSGLGVLRRRPDARWRIEEDQIASLAALQRVLLDAAVALVRPGGLLVYSVCTLTAAETLEVDSWLASTYPDLEPVSLGGPWRPAGRGGRLLPQDEDTDGMFVLALRAPGPVGARP